MNHRTIRTICALALAAVALAPAALAADLTGVGYMDQAQIAALPAFVAANARLAAYQNQLQQEFQGRIAAARTPAQKQEVALEFQQRMADRQREIIGPLYDRIQLALAQVSSTRRLSVVLDKRIVVYGGQDITQDVKSLFESSKALSPPQATPPPSPIGFVDQSALDGAPIVQKADKAFADFAEQQKKIFEPKLQQAKTPQQKMEIANEYSAAMNDERRKLLDPIVRQTRDATARVAQEKHLVLVVDAGDVLFGGTDITQDVRNALGG
jgi:outer membrane protein